MDIVELLRLIFPSQAAIAGANLPPNEVRSTAWSIPRESNLTRDAYDCLCAFFLTRGAPPTFDTPFEGIERRIEDWARAHNIHRDRVWPLGVVNPALIPSLFTTRESWEGTVTVGFADVLQAACTLRILRQDFPAADAPVRQTDPVQRERVHGTLSAGDTGTTNTGWSIAQTPPT